MYVGFVNIDEGPTGSPNNQSLSQDCQVGFIEVFVKVVREPSHTVSDINDAVGNS